MVLYVFESKLVEKLPNLNNTRYGKLLCEKGITFEHYFFICFLVKIYKQLTHVVFARRAIKIFSRFFRLFIFSARFVLKVTEFKNVVGQICVPLQKL